MAAVTKNLGFAITTSTSYEQAYVVAKRFSTLDHLTKGRFGWNIVTSWKESASKAVSPALYIFYQVVRSKSGFRLACRISSTIHDTRMPTSMSDSCTSELATKNLHDLL